MERNILQALIVYLLSLVVALVAMFVCFWIINRAASKGELQIADILTAIVIYMALIYVLILLHTALQDRFVVDSVLYLEYFFFTTYFTTFMLISHSLLIFGNLNFIKNFYNTAPNSTSIFGNSSLPFGF